MAKDTPLPLAETPVDPAALEAKLRAEIESNLRAEYEAKLAAAEEERKAAVAFAQAAREVPAAATAVSGRPARYYHQQGTDLIGVPVVVVGTTLHHPDTGDILVTAAKSSPTPANGRYVLD